MRDCSQCHSARLVSIFIIILILFIPSLAICKSAPIKITGLYSNMYYNDTAGDLLGYELFIVYARDNYYVFYQSSEGEPDVPQLIPVKVEGSAISFTIPSGASKLIQFNGKITVDGLTGRFSNSNTYIILKRKKSYWQ